MAEAGVISPAELKKRLDEGTVLFMFDLRNTDEFEAWRIEGRTDFEVLNIPQIDFVGEEQSHLHKFPKDKEIITVCAHGDSAKYTADLLVEHGFKATALAGGMDAWSEFYEIHKVSERPLIYQIYRVAKGCMSYVIACDNEAIVVDTVIHVDKIMDLLKSLGLKVLQVIDTHLQADHISGGRDLAKQTGAIYRINKHDAEGASYPFVSLNDKEEIKVGNCKVTVLHSPGHTPGSSSLLVEGKYLLTGDIIMKTSIGRPDLGGHADEWALMLYDTLFNRFKDLSDEIVVLPTHASSVKEQSSSGVISLTLGEARKGSDLYQIVDKAKFVSHIKSSLLENPERYQDIRKYNLGQADFSPAKLKELEIGKNLCGMASK